MFCTHCGTEINTRIREADGAVVCPGCGTRYRKKAKPKPAPRPAAAPAVRSVPPRAESARRDSRSARKPAKGRSAAGTVLRVLSALLLLVAAACLIKLFLNWEAPARSSAAGKRAISCLVSEYTYTDSETLLLRYDYDPNGLLRTMKREQSGDTDGWLLVSYQYRCDASGNPTRIRTSVTWEGEDGFEHTADDGESLLALREAGAMDGLEPDPGLYLLSAEIENSYRKDGFLEARLHDLTVGGRSVSLDAPDRLELRELDALNAVLLPFARSPLYDDAKVSWGESAVTRKNGEIVYSCLACPGARKTETERTQTSGGMKTAERSYTGGSAGLWTPEAETVVTTDAGGFVAACTLRQGRSEPLNCQIERKDRDDTVTVKVTEPDSGRVYQRYVYDSAGVLIRVWSFDESGRTETREYDPGGKLLRLSLELETRDSMGRRQKRITEYEYEDFFPRSEPES